MRQSLKRILALSRIILIDGFRRHALIGLLALSLATEAGGLLFFDFIPRDIGRASGDFIFSITWLAGFIFIFFHAVQVIAWDEERRTIHALLARPLSRSEYVIGVFIGLAGLLMMINLILGSIGWGTLVLIRYLVPPDYFTHLYHHAFLLSWLGLFTMELLILSAVMFFSGILRGGFAVLLVSISYYLICTGLPVVRASFAQRLPEGTVSVLALLLKGMTFVFPDLGQLDFKNYIVSLNQMPSYLHIFMTFGLFYSYALIMLWLASLVYQRRDLQ